MLGTWVILTCTQDVPQNKSYIQDVLTSAQCRHILRTLVNHNSTVMGNHIAGTYRRYISNVKEMLLVITLDTNVEVTFEM